MSDKPDKPLVDLAVALQYEKGTRTAPKVTAKGPGEVARRIVATAEEHGVTVEANRQLAEALAGVDLDATIPVELYEAAAEVIGMVLRAAEKRRSSPLR